MVALRESNPERGVAIISAFGDLGARRTTQDSPDQMERSASTCVGCSVACVFAYRIHRACRALRRCRADRATAQYRQGGS